MKIQAIIPMAGIGTRFKSDLPKPFIELCGKPLFIYTLEAFEKSLVIDSVVLVGQKEYLPQVKDLLGQYGIKKVTKIVAGGKTRRESVASGLAAVDKDADLIVIHDGVRPLVTSGVIKDTVGLCEKWGAAVAAVRVKSTIKKVNPEGLYVEETLQRDALWEIQTPQAFKKSILIEAHRKDKDENPTDDAMMVEKLGIKVRIAPGDYRNIKITTQEDLVVAQALLQAKNSSDGAIA